MPEIKTGKIYSTLIKVYRVLGPKYYGSRAWHAHNYITKLDDTTLMGLYFDVRFKIDDHFQRTVKGFGTPKLFQYIHLFLCAAGN